MGGRGCLPLHSLVHHAPRVIAIQAYDRLEDMVGLIQTQFSMEHVGLENPEVVAQLGPVPQGGLIIHRVDLSYGPVVPGSLQLHVRNFFDEIQLLVYDDGVGNIVGPFRIGDLTGTINYAARELELHWRGQVGAFLVATYTYDLMATTPAEAHYASWPGLP